MNIAEKIANEYMNEITNGNTEIEVLDICKNKKQYSHEPTKNIKPKVSKILRKHNFNKATEKINLIIRICTQAKESGITSKPQIIDYIHSNTKLKKTFIQKKINQLENTGNISAQIQSITNGHSYQSTVKSSNLSRYNEEKLRLWFVHTFKGNKSSTYNNSKKYIDYLDIEEIVNFTTDKDLLTRTWSAIGFIFSDGHISDNSIVIVISRKDESYLKDKIVPTLCIKGSPKIQHAISNSSQKSYKGSGEVSRIELTNTKQANFLRFIGDQNNKEKHQVHLTEKVLNLTDECFFSFLCGLFDGDGCVTICSRSNLTLYLDLNNKTLCHDIADQITLRTDIPAKVQELIRNKKPPHYRVAITTTWRTLSLIATILRKTPYIMERKFDKILINLSKVNDRLIHRYDIDLENIKNITEIEYLNIQKSLKIRARKTH